MAGRIYSKEEADKLFGPVLNSISLTADLFKELLNQAGENIMFRIADGKLFIAGDNRKVLYPAGAVIKKDDVFARLSKTVAVECLDLGRGDNIAVEQREKHLTVTDGGYTIEELTDCPPDCY